MSGCASFGLSNLFGESKPDVKPVEIVSKPVEKTPLNIAMPDPINVKQFEWIIVTKDNADAVLTELEKRDIDPAVFGLTDDGYQQLSITVAEMRNLIARYREILIKYKEYYEPVKKEETVKEQK